ncbi:ferric enterobactin receptor [Azospira sp. I13]|nr:ferric enterobactin receptor [Azospira sp. I13]
MALSRPVFPLPPLLPLLIAAFPLTAGAADGDTTSAPATAKETRTLAEVTVSANRLSDTDQRRFATAAKMVFGREELDRYGDSSLGDVLKRLPGVTLSGTPGRGGDIRMRGLGNGYTLILINGEPAPRGFSMDSIPPEQVERIEVMRAPVAEPSTRAIAGTINIILREDLARRQNDFRPSLALENGRFQPSVSLQRSDSFDNFGYNLNANLMHRNQESQVDSLTSARDRNSGATTLLQQEQSRSRSESDGLHLSSRLNWKLGGGDTLSLQPFFTQHRGVTTGDAVLNQSLGATPAPYASAHWRTDSDSSMLRLMGNWKHRLEGGGRLDIRFNGGLASSDSSTSRREYDDSGKLSHTSWRSTGIDDRSFSTSGKLTQPMGGNHNMAIGWEVERGQRQESATTLQDEVLQLATFGSELEASTRRFAAFAQDEWEVSPLWSLYGGLRWETIRTRSTWASGSAGNDSSVVSPLFHSVWRFTEESKDQIRLGLTRSYKAPTLGQLVPRPTLSSTYPASGANTVDKADSAGNPDLKPELAWGLDLALEHYLAQGGILSASLFQRNIDNLIRSVTSLQSVDWSPVQRWVTSPTNIGKATTRGIELEAKFRLAEFLENAPPLDLRANVSRFWSEVEGVMGPNNRLDQQPTYSANLGADYRLRSLPLTIGGNMNWIPAYTVQQSNTQIYTQSLKRVYDVYAIWRVQPDTQVRFSAANLLQADYDTGMTYLTSNTERMVQSSTKTYRILSARLEIKF